MKKRLRLICFCLLIGMGCQKKKKHIVPQEKMVNILVDIHLIEASLLGFTDEQKDSLIPIYYNQIYEIHSIPKDNYLAEMKYLKSQPDSLSKIYEKVLEEIDKREAEFK